MKKTPLLAVLRVHRRTYLLDAIGDWVARLRSLLGEAVTVGLIANDPDVAVLERTLGPIVRDGEPTWIGKFERYRNGYDFDSDLLNLSVPTLVAKVEPTWFLWLHDDWVFEDGVAEAISEIVRAGPSAASPLLYRAGTHMFYDRNHYVEAKSGAEWIDPVLFRWRPGARWNSWRWTFTPDAIEEEAKIYGREGRLPGRRLDFGWYTEAERENARRLLKRLGRFDQPPWDLFGDPPKLVEYTKRASWLRRDWYVP